MILFTMRVVSLCFVKPGLSRIDHANVSGLHFHLVLEKRRRKVSTTPMTLKFRYPAYCWAMTWLQKRFWEEIKNNGGKISIMKFLLDRNNVSAARAFAFELYVFSWRSRSENKFSSKLYNIFWS